MGAGESAVLEILGTIFEAGPGCLLIIDEIELGLHPKAQIEFIRVLKTLCEEIKCQVICTTHSFEILAALPPEARFYIEKSGSHIQILPGISPEYASGKMGGAAPKELDIFVEDAVALAIVQVSLTHELRARCQALEIGSHGSLKRLMASRYMENKRNCLCLMDGDQRTLLQSIKSAIASFCDGKFSNQQDAIRFWAEQHVDFMPGEEWPEKWLFSQAINCCEGILSIWKSSLSQKWGLENNEVLKGALEAGLAAGKHNEFSNLATFLSLSEEDARRDLIIALRESVPTAFDAISERVSLLLLL